MEHSDLHSMIYSHSSTHRQLRLLSTSKWLFTLVTEYIIHTIYMYVYYGVPQPITNDRCTYASNYLMMSGMLDRIVFKDDIIKYKVHCMNIKIIRALIGICIVIMCHVVQINNTVSSRDKDICVDWFVPQNTTDYIACLAVAFSVVRFGTVIRFHSKRHVWKNIHIFTPKQINVREGANQIHQNWRPFHCNLTVVFLWHQATYTSKPIISHLYPIIPGQ